MCYIVYEQDESVDRLRATSTQLRTLDFIHRYPWAEIGKYRQAKVSTVVLKTMLRDCMYVEGMRGLLVAEREDTAKDLFERIQFSYSRLPKELRAPLKEGTSGAATQMQFWHGGSIKIQTTGGKAPAIGRGLGWLHITEFGEAAWQKRAAINIVPTISKRPNARFVLESTPGRAGSHFQQMWKDALAGRSRFRALFLEWWKDDTCTVDPTGFEPTAEELIYLTQHGEMQLKHLAFRRTALHTEFAGDTRLFSSKYPGGPYDGWIGDSAPVFPEDALQDALKHAIALPSDTPNGLCEIPHPETGGTAPIEDRPHLITADPAGFGGAGDPSALIAWDSVARVDIGAWSGREDPARFARRIMTVAEYLTTDAGPPLVAVESNATACIAILRDLNCPNLLWNHKSHPGWYATEGRIQEAEARMVRMLRADDLHIRNMPTLHQLSSYDGRRKAHAQTSEGSTHHFDLARCAIVAADILSRRRFSSIRADYEDGERGPGTISGAGLTLGQLDELRDSLKRNTVNPFRPPPRW